MNYETNIIKDVIERNDGIASLEQLQKAGISRAIIYTNMVKGILNKTSHGKYTLADQHPDEFRVIQSRSERVVFSHATALYLHGLSDRVPHTLDITIPQGDNVSKIKRDYENTRFHYCKKDLWNVGLTHIVTPQGFSVKAYDEERCICDLIKDRKKVDSQIFIQAIREYFLNRLDSRKMIKYSKQMNVEEKVRMYMEVLQPL